MTPYADPEQARAYGARHYQQRVGGQRVLRLAEARLGTPEIPMLELSWAAGLFEGEGTCSITRKGEHWTRAGVSVPSVDPQTTDFYRERWGGFVSLIEKPGNARPVHVWSLRGAPMYRFLRQLRPYLRRDLVAEKFDLVIADFERRILDPRNESARDAFLARSLELNRRGRIV
jgi:hypothetical protein